MTRTPSTTLRVVTMLGTIGIAVAACGSSSTLPPSARSGTPLAPTTTRIVVPTDEEMDASSGGARSDPDDAPGATNDDPTTDGIDSTTTVEGTGAASDGVDRPQVADAWNDATSNLVDLPSECGTLHYMTSHPATGDVIAGVAAQGLWQLDQEMGTWNRLGAGEGSAQITSRPTSITFDPLEPQRYWVSGIYGGGVYRTDDGGATFRQLGDVAHIDYVSVDMSDPFRQTLLAGGHEDRKLYRSGDGGVTWTEITESLPIANIGYTSFPVVIDADTHLLGTWWSEGSGIFRSVDGGTSWEQVHQGGVVGNPLIVDGKIYWASDAGGILVSTDDGMTFEPGGAPTGGRPMPLVSMGDGRLVTWGGGTLVVSDDDGKSWYAFGPQLLVELDGIAYGDDPSSFYAWTHTCPREGATIVQAGSISRLDGTSTPTG